MFNVSLALSASGAKARAIIAPYIPGLKSGASTSAGFHASKTVSQFIAGI